MKFLLFVALSFFAVTCVLPTAMGTSFAWAGLPSPQVVDGKLKATHLDAETASWDRLNKDLLYRRAATLDLAQLKQHYPHLAPEKLERLKRLTHRTAFPSMEGAP